MAENYTPEAYEGGSPMRYRDQEGRRTQYRPEDYGGQEYYEGSRGGRWDEETAWREEGRGEDQGWQRRLQGGEWQRQQEWELAGGPSSGRWPEAQRGRPEEWPRGRSRGAVQSDYYSEYDPYARGGGGAEYREDPYRSRGGYGAAYRGGPYGSSSGMYNYGQRGQGVPGPYTGRGPKGYRRSDDRIKEDVCERLTRHPEVDAEDIDVDVKDGEVFLKGSVMDRYQKRMAEDAVEGISGVKDVNNQLRVGMGGAGERQQARAGARSSTGAGMSATGSRSGTPSVSRGTGKGSGASAGRRSTGTTSGMGSTSATGTNPSPASSSGMSGSQSPRSS